MFLTIFITLLASLAFLSLGQDCNNPLLAFYNLTPLNAPQSGSNLPYCANLQASQTCCANETVAAFQDRANATINSLNNYAAGRDLYLAELRNRYLERFRNKLRTVDRNQSKNLQAIRANNSALADQLEGIISNATHAYNASRNAGRHFNLWLSEYQKSRSACFDTALETQSSAWCLACDPNYANEGVASNDTVAFSEALCQAIFSACSAYFNNSAAFNPLFTVREQYWQLNIVANYLANYTITKTISNFTLPPNPYSPLPSQNPVTIPPQWVGTGNATNPANCQALWAGDAELASLLDIGVGGQASAANGAWAPDLTGTGLNFSDLRLDPGDYFGATDESDYGEPA